MRIAGGDQRDALALWAHPTGATASSLAAAPQPSPLPQPRCRPRDGDAPRCRHCRRRRAAAGSRARAAGARGRGLPQAAPARACRGAVVQPPARAAAERGGASGQLGLEQCRWTLDAGGWWRLAAAGWCGGASGGCCSASGQLHTCTHPCYALRPSARRCPAGTSEPGARDGQPASPAVQLRGAAQHRPCTQLARPLVPPHPCRHIPHYCGSCWLHGTTSMIQDRLKIVKGGLGPDVMLARQVVLNCGAFHSYGQGCDGGDVIDVVRYMKEFGLPDESCMVGPSPPYPCSGAWIGARPCCGLCGGRPAATRSLPSALCVEGCGPATHTHPPTHPRTHLHTRPPPCSPTPPPTIRNLASTQPSAPPQPTAPTACRSRWAVGGAALRCSCVLWVCGGWAARTRAVTAGAPGGLRFRSRSARPCNTGGPLAAAAPTHPATLACRALLRLPTWPPPVPAGRRHVLAGAHPHPLLPVGLRQGALGALWSCCGHAARAARHPRQRPRCPPAPVPARNARCLRTRTQTTLHTHHPNHLSHPRLNHPCPAPAAGCAGGGCHDE